MTTPTARLGKRQIRSHRCMMAILPAILFPAAIACGQQSTPPASAQLYPVAGTITDSVSGATLPGATLTLSLSQSPTPIRSAQADAEGHFQLDPVPAGKYSLIASRRGYRTAAFDQHENYNSAIVTGPSQDTTHIPFRLDPGAILRGFVTDDAGEPVAGASVVLVQRTRQGGQGERLISEVSGQTDDTGLFEYWSLSPGIYFLAVKADPWFALHPTLFQKSRLETSEQRQAADALDVAYPVTYYDSTIEEASATPIELAAGDRVQADITLHAVPAVHLAVQTSGNPGDYKSITQINMKPLVFGGGDRFPLTFANSLPDGSDSGRKELPAVAPGRYTITVGSPPHIAEMDLTGSQDLDLSAGLPTTQIKLRFKMRDGSKLPWPLQTLLFSENPSQQPLSGATPDIAEVVFEGVPSGKWTLFVQPREVNLAVASIQDSAAPGKQPTPGGQIVVHDKPVSATVLLELAKTNIEGFAFQEGKGKPGVMVVLVPASRGAGLLEFRRDQSDSDGSFLLRDVAPGDYIAIAIQDGWTLDWAQPAALRNYLPNGTAVTVTPSSPATLTLSTPLKVQPR